MPSQTQTTRTNLRYMERAEFLATSIRTQKTTVNGSLAEMYRDAFDGGGPPEPDWDALQEANLALLEGSVQELRETEQNHRRDQLSLDQLRQERRDEVSDLKDGHRSMQNRPEDSFAELVAFRRSFIAPVPGAMAERLEAA